jgi:hypothetical protein
LDDGKVSQASLDFSLSLFWFQRFMIPNPLQPNSTMRPILLSASKTVPAHFCLFSLVLIRVCR